MELCADPGTHGIHSTWALPLTLKKGPALKQELSLSSTHCQTGNGGTILLHLLEFRTLLLEIVEELQIQRDAATHFEDQIHKLVLENQELEWDKESLHHQNETVTNQHTEALMNEQKQFQVKISNIEEEKGIFQVSAELKDKEMVDLKEVLKSLQLLKYNLEKKAIELEQKLFLQSRSKDSHLIQLGEVEKQFSALSRQCNMVKLSYETLEQNVDEAMIFNKKLTSANEKQQSAIVSLKRELDEVCNKLIKANMSKFIHDKDKNPQGEEWCIQQLYQKLKMEYEINKELREENLTLRREKQEVMRSLQHTQELLLSQTQAVRKVEMELQTQKQQYQVLEQEHELIQERSKAMENKVAQLIEIFSKISRDKKETGFRGHSKNQHQDLQAVKEANVEPNKKHTEVISQEEVQSHLCDLKAEFLLRDILSEPISAPKNLVYTQSKTSNCQEDKDGKLVVSQATAGQDGPNNHQQFPIKKQLNCSNSLSSQLPGKEHVQPCSPYGTSSSLLKTHIIEVSTSERNPDVASDLMFPTSPVPNDNVHTSKTMFCYDNNTLIALCASHKSVDDKKESVKGNVNMTEQNHVENDVEKEKKRGEEGQKEKQCCEKEAYREDFKGEVTDGINSQKTGRVAEQEESKQDEKTSIAKERKQTELNTPENHLDAKITTETPAEKSYLQQSMNSIGAEPPLDAIMPSESTQNLSQKVYEKDASIISVNTGCQISIVEQSFCSDEYHYINHWQNYLSHELHLPCHDEVQNLAQDVPLPTEVGVCHQVFGRTLKENSSNSSSGHILIELPQSLDQESTGTQQKKSLSCDGLLGHPACTMPMFLKTNNSKDLLHSCVAETSVLWRHQTEEWNILSKICNETATADMESRAHLSISAPVSTYSTTVSKLSCQTPTTPVHSSAPTSTPGPRAETDWDPSCSPVKEDLQSFRAQISKMEQILNKDRLQLHKRRLTDK